ncbi:translation initiation factor IF-2-like [Peromyscus leucopus]|uniref:translation initiation factor IF-2-like n=1 Tax=Peromyscus leucopus TaxID=10041 RepID=UPI0018855C88|nr:translation initiation factor IF-2-like [Peromyscus leucopus]
MVTGRGHPPLFQAGPRPRALSARPAAPHPAPADALPRRGPLPGDPRAPPPWSARSAAATHAAALAAAAAATAATAMARALRRHRPHGARGACRGPGLPLPRGARSEEPARGLGVLVLVHVGGPEGGAPLRGAGDDPQLPASRAWDPRKGSRSCTSECCWARALSSEGFRGVPGVRGTGPRSARPLPPLEVWGRRLGTSRRNSRPEPETRELRLDNQEPRPGAGREAHRRHPGWRRHAEAGIPDGHLPRPVGESGDTRVKCAAWESGQSPSGRDSERRKRTGRRGRSRAIPVEGRERGAGGRDRDGRSVPRQPALRLPGGGLSLGQASSGSPRPQPRLPPTSLSSLGPWPVLMWAPESISADPLPFLLLLPAPSLLLSSSPFHGLVHSPNPGPLP